MWIKDKYGNPVNMAPMGSLYVSTNPDGGYQVQTNNTTNTMFAQFLTGTPPMTEADAGTLMNRMADMLGVVDLND